MISPSVSLLKLTIGMAVYDDFDGVYMTLQALLMYHADVLKHCELIVVDNNPSSTQGRRTRGLVENWVQVSGRFGHGVRYLALPGINSTSRPRQTIFEQAKAPYVLVCDPHVLFPRLNDSTYLQTSPFQRLIDWFDANPSSFNILHGPMVYDDFRGYATHMTDVFRSEMWGTWGTDERGNPFVENVLHLEPFEIPAHGMGMWACRKEAWEKVGGFHPKQRGFGGEEFTIHTKFHQYGEKHGVDARTLCAPWLPWMHRFNDSTTIKYPLHRVDKLRNYVLLFKELGLPLDRLKNHFLEGNNEDGTFLDYVVTQQQWDVVVADPETYPPNKLPEGLVRNQKKIDQDQSYQDKMTIASKTKTPPTSFSIPQSVMMSIRSYLPKIKLFTFVAFPDFSKERVTLDYHEYLKSIPKPEAFKSSLMNNVIIHNAQTAIELTAALKLAAPITDRFITVTNMGAQGYGEEGKPRIDALGNKQGNPGILPGIRRFCTENPEWTVIHTDLNGIGVMLLGKRPEDKPTLPSYLTMAKNFGAALTTHVAAALTDESGDQATPETVQHRMAICSVCPLRIQEQCSACGCYLPKKASWESSACPIGKWNDPHFQGLGSLEMRIVEEYVAEVPTTEAPSQACTPCGR